MKKLLTVLLLAIFTILSFSACTDNNAPQTGDTSYADIKAKGEIIIGLDDTFAPMGFRDPDGKLVGFDIDLAEAVAEEMGLKAKFQPIDWSTKEMQLETGKVDLLWNGLSITPARKEVMLLTEPYLNNKLVIMTKKGSTIDKISDLVGKKIGIQAASSALEVVTANEIFSSIKDNIVEYPGYDEAIMDLEIGRTEAVIIDMVMGRYKDNNKNNIFAFATEDFGPDEYGVGMKKTATTLFEEFNKAFDKVKANGKASEISQKWFGEDLIIK